MILLNLKNYLQQYDVKDAISYSKIFFYMLHNGFFSMNGKTNFDNNYDYLELPSEISQGVQVMYGICCCRHATDFLYNLLCILEFNPSLIYVLIDNNTGIWRKVNPAIEKANHQAILLNSKYIIDPEYLNHLEAYQDDNITVIGKVLKKYYIYKELGVKNVYS